MRHFHSFFRLAVTGLAVLLTLAAVRVEAYPEFRTFIVKNSGRAVDCAYCHVNRDGPEGTGIGQVGHLTPEELERLGRARAALEPGAKVDSPLLNAFGNHIIGSIGKRKFLELRQAPEQLARVLPHDSDLDHDGIPDAQEYLDGTHPLMASDGRPWLLFRRNFKSNLTEILLAAGATFVGLFGLRHLLNSFAVATSAGDESEDEEV